MFQDVESRTPPAHIAVIGVTGVGKSTFIRNISGIPFSVPVADNIYQKLETREIRLLSICPSLNKSDEICCSLDTVNLDDKPSYLALSYTWDDKNEKRQDIMVNKKRTHVTPNLFSALKSFRSRKFSYLEELPIWVDALCINQDDEKERVRQVQMMHTIYSQAAAVICLHGLAESESPNDLGDKMSGYDGAVKIRFSDTPGIGDTCRSDTRNLIGITDLLRNSGEKTKLSGILYSHPIKRERMKDSATRNLSMFRRLWGENLSKPTVLATSFWDLEQMEGLVDSVPRELSRFTLAPNWGKYWKAFGAFIKRPWFTCGWVVQEFVHPKTVAFHCGEKYTHFIGVGNEIDPEGPPENHPFHQESLEKITFADILGVWTTSAILGIGFVGFESTLHEPSSQIICRTTFVSDFIDQLHFSTDL